jgi:hypothetical protein
MRMFNSLGILAICVPVLLVAGCGRDDGQMSPPEPQEDTQTSNADGGRATAMATAPTLPEMHPESRQSLTEMNVSKTVEPVSAGILKDLLPAELPGMGRIDASAERIRMVHADLTTAAGRYAATGDGGADISITLTDAGNMGYSMRMGLAAWAATQYSRKTATGYEKTAMHDGHRAMEEYDGEGRYGAIRVFVADRFIVEVEGNDITMDTLQQALAKISFRRLADLAPGS